MKLDYVNHLIITTNLHIWHTCFTHNPVLQGTTSDTATHTGDIRHPVCVGEGRRYIFDSKYLCGMCCM